MGQWRRGSCLGQGRTGILQGPSSLRVWVLTQGPHSLEPVGREFPATLHSARTTNPRQCQGSTQPSPALANSEPLTHPCQVVSRFWVTCGFKGKLPEKPCRKRLQRPLCPVTLSILTLHAGFQPRVLGRGRQEGRGVGPINSYKHVTHWPGIQAWDLTSSPSFGAALGNICRRVTVFPEEPFFVPRAPDSLRTRPSVLPCQA